MQSVRPKVGVSSKQNKNFPLRKGKRLETKLDQRLHNADRVRANGNNDLGTNVLPQTSFEIFLFRYIKNVLK